MGTERIHPSGITYRSVGGDVPLTVEHRATYTGGIYLIGKHWEVFPDAANVLAIFVASNFKEALTQVDANFSKWSFRSLQDETPRVRMWAPDGTEWMITRQEVVDE